jgi:hypothetical protein
MERTYAPFTEDQIRSITDYHRAWQWWMWMVCPNSVNGSHGHLETGVTGLSCNVCNFVQDWVPAYLVDWSWTKVGG